MPGGDVAADRQHDDVIVTARSARLREHVA
jgi:hypothetical protein